MESKKTNSEDKISSLFPMTYNGIKIFNDIKNFNNNQSFKSNMIYNCAVMKD